MLVSLQLRHDRLTLSVGRRILNIDVGLCSRGDNATPFEMQAVRLVAFVFSLEKLGKISTTGRGSGVDGAGAGVGFGGAPAGVDLVKGARRRIRARAGRSPFYALFPAPPPTPRAPGGRRPQIASQPLPTNAPSASLIYMNISVFASF